MTTASSGNTTVPVKALLSLVESSHLAVGELLGWLLEVCWGGIFFLLRLKKNKKNPEMSSDGKVRNNQAVVIYPPSPGQA